jgi:hypothetical protein
MTIESDNYIPSKGERNPSPMKMDKAFNRFGWLIVMTAAFAFSTWSLFVIARHYGAPAPAAVIVSLFFDGAAVLCADYSLKYARTGDSGFIPQCGVFTLAGLSSYLNSQHAALNHNPPAARVLYAAPPIVAVAIYELHVRWERRRALRNSGRIPAAMPVFGRYAWALFPVRTVKVLRSITAGRLAMIHATNTPAMFLNSSAEFPELPAEFSGTNPGFALMPGQSPVSSPELPGGADAVSGSPARVRLWARSVGIQVNRRGPIPKSTIDAYFAALAQFKESQTAAIESEPEPEPEPVPESPKDDSGPINFRGGYL